MSVFSFSVDPFVSCLNAIPSPNLVTGWLSSCPCRLFSFSDVKSLAVSLLKCWHKWPHQVSPKVHQAHDHQLAAEAEERWEQSTSRMDGALRSTAPPATPDHEDPSARLPPRVGSSRPYTSGPAISRPWNLLCTGTCIF